MRSHNLNYAAVGIFVIAMLVGALGGVIMLSGHGAARDDYRMVFDNVADVKFGSQVRFEGFPVGQVEAIEPLAEDGKTRFLLRVSISRGWPIPDDSIARVTSSNFLGAKTIDIARGRSAESLQPGSRIKAAPPVDMFSAFSSVAAEVGDLTRNELRTFLDELTELAKVTNGLVDTDLRGSLQSVNNLAGSLEKSVPAITGELLTFTKDLNHTLAKAQRLLSERNVGGVEKTIHNVEEASRQFVEFSIRSQATLAQINDFVADLDQMVEANEGKVSAAVSDARYSLRAIARNIDSINHNFEGTARNMNEFSRLIRQNPGLLLSGSPRREAQFGTTAGNGRSKP